MLWYRYPHVVIQRVKINLFIFTYIPYVPIVYIFSETHLVSVFRACYPHPYIPTGQVRVAGTSLVRMPIVRNVVCRGLAGFSTVAMEAPRLYGGYCRSL